MDPGHALDLSQPLRGVTALESLVRFVVATNTKNETDWLEWKVGLDLLAADGRFSVAKQIIGFGNRDPARRLDAGGCAYVVLGAEPTNLAGQTSLDPADLTSGLRRYVGDDGPAWSPLWVTVDGVDVLVITVEPPRPGDHIHTLRKEVPGGLQEGTVFIRRPGGTHQASTAEHRMLQRRLLDRPGDDALELSVRVEPEEIRPLDLDREVEEWIGQQRSALLDPLEKHRRTAAAPRKGISVHKVFESDAYKASQDAADQMRELQETIRQLSATPLLTKTEPETRTEEEFETEVEAYLEQSRTDAPEQAKELYVQLGIAHLALTVENDTIRNIPSIEVTLTLDGEVFSFDANRAPAAPLAVRPRPWGPIKRPVFPDTRAFLGLSDVGRFSSMSAAIGPVAPPPFRTDNHGSTTIRFRPVDLRPGHAVSLPSVNVLVVRTPDVDVIRGRWHATSNGVDGIVQQEIEIALAEPIGLLELIEASRRKKDDERSGE